MTQIIYFDAEDEQMDGNGWNIVAMDWEDSIAVRFATIQEAQRWCVANNFEFRVEEQKK